MLFVIMLPNFTLFIWIILIIFVSANIDDNAWSRTDDVVYIGPKIVMEGNSFEIKCIMSVFDSPRWTKNDRLIEENERVAIVHMLGAGQTRMLKLVVINASSSDSGIYRCNSFSRSFHRIDIISDQKSYTIAKQSESILFEEIEKENSTVTLVCPQSIDNNAKVYWYKNGIQLNENSRRRFINSKLIIKQANSGDAGDYMCKIDLVSTAGGLQFGQLIQLRAPIKAQPFESVKSVVMNETLYLECKYSGFPLGKITWRIGNQILTTDEMKSLGIELVPNQTEHPDAILKIGKMNQEHGNLYTCFVENQFTSDEASIRITVRRNQIKTNADDKGYLLINDSKPFFVECKIDGENTEFNWRKDDKDIEPFNETDRISFQDKYKSKLIIKSANKEDAGDYACSTTYRSELITEDIKVRFRPRLYPFEEFHKTNYRSANIVEGEKFQLKCQVYPDYSLDAKLNWYSFNESVPESEMIMSPEKEIKPGGRVKITWEPDYENGTVLSILTIDKVIPSDRAYYVCQADNGAAKIENTILLRVKDKLGALWPFLGIVGEVIILCTIIFVYEKRRVKPDFDESDADHNLESKSLQDRSGKSQEIRQRK